MLFSVVLFLDDEKYACTHGKVLPLDLLALACA